MTTSEHLWSIAVEAQERRMIYDFLVKIDRLISRSIVRYRKPLGLVCLVLFAGLTYYFSIERYRSAPQSPASGGHHSPKKTAFFVSIDGLQPDLTEALKKAGVLSHPKGLGWMLDDSMVSSEAAAVITPITAASHISTVTCTPPSRHGIVGNSYLRNGLKVNGFNEPFTPEPLWRAAMRQGKVVLTLGYVGTDGTTENRQPSLSIAYPQDSLFGPAQTLTWNLSELEVAHGWSFQSELKDLAGRQDLRETTITITLNPKTQETRTVHVLLAPTEDHGVRLFFGPSKDLTKTYGSLLSADQNHPVLDFFFTEENPNSSLKGAKRRVFARTLKAPHGSVRLYFSRASYNHALPESFRRDLDDANLVWPDYGVKDPELNLAEWVEAQAMIDRFLTDVGVKFIPKYAVDVVLFYQPLIDALGHKMQARLPLPFNPKAQDDVTKAYVQAFATVDENLSRLFSTPTADGPYFVMGDHGMDPIQKSINVAALLPKDHVDKVDVFSVGDLLLVYPLQNAKDQKTAIETALLVGEQLRKTLETTKVAGESVLGFAYKKTDFRQGPSSDLSQEWHYGDAVWAFAGSTKHWLQYQPLSSELVLEPNAYGMHGKSVKSTDMATLFVAKGRGIPSKDIGPMSLLQAVPTFSKLIGIDPPKDCLGSSLL